MITIGKLAALAGVTAEGLRYYEREALLAPAGKTSGGYRLYGEDAVRRLRFIKHAQECGFTLVEIRELLELRQTDAACCRDVRSVAVEKKLQLEQKIKALQAMSRALSKLIASCADEEKSLDECPILGALEGSVKQDEEEAEK